MSHRKFHAPRHGSLAFLPRKRCKKARGHIRSFPPDNKEEDCHLTAFIGYKAGMTHIMRTLNRPGSKAHGKDIVEGVTIIEAPPMTVVGLVGLITTPTGKRSVSTVWASHMDDSYKRRFYKNWCRSHKKAFTAYEQLWAKAAAGEDPKEVKKRLDLIRKFCDTVRVIAHSKVKMLKNMKTKKAHVMEIQINGGSIEDKVKFGYDLFEKSVSIHDVFSQNESIDTISITRGHGHKGVINRWGVTQLPRKTHRGLRKVACIGTWHPTRVQFQVPRSGQNGYGHRTEINKKIYRIGKKEEVAKSCTTEQDLTEKGPTPIGGFSRYGEINEDWVMVKGTVMGARKRIITLRKSLLPQNSRTAQEEINLKFIDTSSKFGHGRFQTREEKAKFFGGAVTKKAKKEDKADA